MAEHNATVTVITCIWPFIENTSKERLILHNSSATQKPHQYTTNGLNFLCDRTTVLTDAIKETPYIDRRDYRQFDILHLNDNFKLTDT